MDGLMRQQQQKKAEQSAAAQEAQTAGGPASPAVLSSPFASLASAAAAGRFLRDPLSFSSLILQGIINPYVDVHLMTTTSSTRHFFLALLLAAAPLHLSAGGRHGRGHASRRRHPRARNVPRGARQQDHI